MAEDRVDRAFQVSLWLKGIDGVLELVGGFLLLVVSPENIGSLISFLTRHELSEDPRDFIANYILQQVSKLPKSAALLGGLYLLSHGIIKLVLVVAVLRQRLWAYPWMIAFLIAFIVYQAYRMALSPSVWLGLLTAFDILVVVLTWIEYKRHREANILVT
ncbi:MAG: DUF2127 domain-containing protein [Acidimicrobiia bacterium]